jgi:hypothetical protein
VRWVSSFLTGKFSIIKHLFYTMSVGHVCLPSKDISSSRQNTNGYGWRKQYIVNSTRRKPAATLVEYTYSNAVCCSIEINCYKVRSLYCHIYILYSFTYSMSWTWHGILFNATFNTFLWIDLQSKVYKLFSLSTLFLIFIISYYMVQHCLSCSWPLVYLLLKI